MLIYVTVVVKQQTLFSRLRWKNWRNLKVVGVLSDSTTWRKGLISSHTGNSAAPHGWCCHLRAEVCCQGLGWHIDCCPEYTELLLCCCDAHLISCFRQTLKVDSVGAWTCKWYLQEFGLEYCQSEWEGKHGWVCIFTLHIFMSGLVSWYILCIGCTHIVSDCLCLCWYVQYIYWVCSCHNEKVACTWSCFGGLHCRIYLPK